MDGAVSTLDVSPVLRLRGPRAGQEAEKGQGKKRQRLTSLLHDRTNLPQQLEQAKYKGLMKGGGGSTEGRRRERSIGRRRKREIGRQREAALVSDVEAGQTIGPKT